MKKKTGVKPSMSVMQNRKVLEQTFFARPAVKVARELLGKHLVRRIGKTELAAMITEVEAYVGPHDLACHARFGRTPRTEVMYGAAGHWYVYLCYGIHWMLNVVTDAEDWPAAVLVRAAGEFIGPGKLTKGLKIGQRLNTLPATPSTGLWVEDRGIRVPRIQVERTPRIGIDYAGEWKHELFRFVLNA